MAVPPRIGHAPKKARDQGARQVMRRDFPPSKSLSIELTTGKIHASRSASYYLIVVSSPRYFLMTISLAVRVRAP